MQTEKVLEKVKIKVKEKEKAKERAKTKKARNILKEASHDLGLQPGGRNSLVLHQMAQQTDLLANTT